MKSVRLSARATPRPSRVGLQIELVVLLLSLVLSHWSMLDDSDDSDGPPPVHSNTMASPSKPDALPAALTAAANLVQPGVADEWIVRIGDDVPKFLFANGPGRIVLYNFNVVAERHHKDYVIRRHIGPKADYADIFELTESGRRAVGSNIGWRVELACSGQSLYDKPAPNCRRLCCGGFGRCQDHCEGGERFSNCSVRVIIKATLVDIAAGQVLISLHGQHTSRAVQPVPPPLNGLRPMPAELQKLRERCAQGEMPSVVVNAAIAALGEGAERNTRFAPPARVLAGCKKRSARAARGGSGDDATRVDQLVRCHLIQRGMVLLYIPGKQLVLTTPWALELGREDGRFMVATDAKVDTVTGVRSKWTSVRFKTRRGLSAPACVWIAPEENSTTVEHGFQRLSANMRCHSPSCPHTLIETHGPDGRYERRLSCELWWKPAVIIDKHIPSYNGLLAAGFIQIRLCKYHGFHCFDSRLVELSILGRPAEIINWGFRLLTRAETDDKAFDLRDSYARILVRQAAMPDRLWTLENAEAVTDYVDKCWMYPDWVRQSWIDARGLELMIKLLKGSYLDTTGISEWSHGHWVKIVMKSLTNKLISQTIVKTIGITANGELAVDGGFFQDAQTRWSDAEGRPLPESTDRKVRRAKACLGFLTLGADCIYPHPLASLSTAEYGARHAQNDQDETREWHRHRRTSGGRMSSAFQQPPPCAPDDAELSALVIGACNVIYEQQVEEDVSSAERSIWLSDVREHLEPHTGDLSSRTELMQQHLDEFLLCRRAHSTACTLVPHLPEDHIRRHAEAPDTLRASRGLSPEFPAELQQMRELLAHGGPLSFAKEGFVSVHNATGRCECLDSTWHGVLSATLTGGCDDECGGCKHDQLRRLCAEAATSPAAAMAVQKRCTDYLCDYIYERERTKSPNHCLPLYTAAAAGDIESLLVALQRHPSIPPSGKGVASGTAESSAAASDGESAESEHEADVDPAVEAAERLDHLPRMHCTFAAAELAKNGFGLTFAANDDAGGGRGIVVAAFSSLLSGGHGPAIHTGEQIRPRDVVLQVGGDDTDPAEFLLADGQLCECVPAGSSADFEFVRPTCAAATGCLGGRPAKVKPKHGRNARGKAKAHASRVRDAELLGGAPSRVARKPQRARATDGTAIDAGEPSADEQVEAVFRAVATSGGTSAEQQRELERISSEIEARLLARRELGASERAARDAELLEMVYSQ